MVASLLLLVGVAASTPWHKLGNYTFDDFEREFSRSFETASERSLRRALFDDRVADVRRHNAQPGVSWHRGVNHFTDRTAAELGEMRGLDRALHFAQPGAGAQPPPAHLLDDTLKLEDLPTSVDWRSKNVITPVKNQGGCGSCWTFSAAETLESHWAIKHEGMLEELSEQFILDCTPNPHECGGTGGCGGGSAACTQRQGLARPPASWATR